MTPEEYQRLKEAEKKHLKELKQLKRRARTAGRMASSLSALQQMTDAVTNLGATQDEALDKLTRDQAVQDARIDMALDAASAKTAEANQTEANEAELKRLKAEALIRQMKLEMGGGSSTSTRPIAHAASPSAGKPAADALPDPTSPTDGLPEKTLGRMKPRGDDAT